MTKQQLNEYFEAEFENITATLKELSKIVKPNKSDYSTAELAAIATFLHNFYNGIENILKRVLLSKEKEIKKTATWHKDLLKTSSDLSIINKELSEKLANYLSFRHFFVHGYSFTLEWGALKPLVSNIKKTLKDFRVEINKEL